MDAGDRIEKAVKALLRRKVIVGIPSDGQQTPTGSKTPPPLWVIGYINEFGNDELHIPPRPFLVPGIESVKGQIAKRMELAIRAALSDNLEQADRQLDAVGLLAQAAVKEQITNVLQPPLAESTLYKRKHRKKPPPVNRESPLIDQGDLLRSINYAVKGR